VPDSLPPRAAAKRLILIADDDPAVLEVTRRMARSLGWRPLVADSAAQALELFRERAREIECVLVDLHMPVMSGLQMLRAIRALEPGVRFVVMTGDDDAAQGFASEGARDCRLLLKPFLLGDLGEALDAAAPGRVSASREGGSQ